MSTPDLTRLIVLAPKGSGRMHLHLPGYRPGKKLRTQGNAPLCGVFVYPDLEQASLEQGRLWTRVRATWAGSGDAGSRYWCPPCLGRLVELFALQDSLIGDVAARIAMINKSAVEGWNA